MTARTFYYAPGACSLASHIALEEAGAAFEAVPIDFASEQQRSAQYLAVNDKGRVPAFVEDGWLLTENAAILRHVARSFPAAGLWPDDPREQARADEWMAWLGTSHHIAFAHVRRPERYSDDEGAYAAIRGKGRETYSDLATMTEVRLSNGGWALGTRYTVVDPYLLVFWLWAQRPGVALDVTSEFPAWTAHARAMAERPAVQRVLAREGLKLPA